MIIEWAPCSAATYELYAQSLASSFTSGGSQSGIPRNVKPQDCALAALMLNDFRAKNIENDPSSGCSNIVAVFPVACSMSPTISRP